MLTNYLKVALRNLRRHKMHGAINIFGLALGLACCILALLFVTAEMSYDAFHRNADTLYRITATYNDFTFTSTPDPLVPALVDTYPEVVQGTRLWETDVVVRSKNDLFQETLLFADSTFFNLFSFPLNQGDPTTALASPQSVVLSAETATQYFPEGDALGKVVSIYLGDDPYDFRVTGVAAPIPASSTLQFSFLAPYRSTFLLRQESLETTWMSYEITSFVQLDEAQSATHLEAILPDFIDHHMGEAIRADGESVDAFGFTFEALTDYHLSGESAGAGMQASGDPSYVYLLAGIALLVLLIACFNYMNLSIGQASSRFREIGMRKVLGAQRRQLIRQFWLEAVLLSGLALLVGLMLAEVLLPVFNDTAGTSLTLNYFDNSLLLLALAALTVLTGLSAGSYPALALSRLPSLDVFKGTRRLGGRSLLTRTFVVVQFCLSIVLIISMLIMNQQQQFMTDQNLGFDKEHVVVIPTQVSRTNAEEGALILDYFKNELFGQPNIVHITGSSNSFGRGTMVSFIEKEDGSQTAVYEYRIDYDYLETLGLELTAGRNFLPDLSQDASQSILVNEAFVRAFAQEYGIENPVGFTLPRQFVEIDNPRIVGVVKDYHFQALRSQIHPALLHLNPAHTIQYVLVKVIPEDLPATLALLRRTWETLRPDQPFAFHFLDDAVDQQYQNEARWSQAIGYASGLALVLACLGLFGLTALTVSWRTKEIGIRKVLGSSVSSIVVLLSQEFVTLVLVANVLAWPLAYLAMHRWLEDFAYRVEISGWIFLGAGLFALLVAILTVGYKAIKAATTDPVKSLRYE